ncbi:chorismate mutase [Micromonospora peucetia]|uniref:Chorismate mutase n=1 Tax=Micromonospora peucetia TaxID=47871 RepID=A0A1C6VB86_9ACTN|nr:chorismate mutase [Micromonospora peucetia]MCX4389534.1 chorismate mutase [Micromonospora peucetia]WSA30018.1 chorismate mutase [Micromonospora peucetia]SCL63612.1 chorismate mutase [Micromonospora peucetia]
MMTDVVESDGSLARPEAGRPGPGASGSPADVPGGADDTKPEAGTGTPEPTAAARIVEIRERIDEIDRALIELWQERARLSQEVGVTRMASGGTRLVLSREREILERFRAALGADGTQLALLLLRAGRGPL